MTALETIKKLYNEDDDDDVKGHAAIGLWLANEELGQNQIFTIGAAHRGVLTKISVPADSRIIVPLIALLAAS